MEAKEEERRKEHERMMEELRVQLETNKRFIENGAAWEREIEHFKAEMKRQYKIGAAAIEWFPADGYTLSGSVFTRTGGSNPTLLSSEFGQVVLDKAKSGTLFSYLSDGGGWDMHAGCQYQRYKKNRFNDGSACAGGKVGQRVVLEADGRDGKRTLRLSQDGQTQPSFFSHIPVPFRFALYLEGSTDAISIESVEAVKEPTLIGGTMEVRMDQWRTLFYNYTELNKAVNIGPHDGGMTCEFNGVNNYGVILGSGIITFNSDATRPIDAIFNYIKIWSYYVVDNEWPTYIIACVDYTYIEFKNCIIADYSSEVDVELPPRTMQVCVWDGQTAGVRIANTRCNIVNTTFDGIGLGGLSLRNALPWTDPAPGEPGILLTIDTFKFRNNQWEQPSTVGDHALAPFRNMFLLSESTEPRQIIIEQGDDDFDGKADLSGPLEIYDRGVDVMTYAGDPKVLVNLHPKRTEPSFEHFTFSSTRGSTRNTTTVTLTVEGHNLYRCGSNAFTVSPYFNDEPPKNPTWRSLTIIESTGTTKIVAEAKSSDLWPAGKWLLRATIASTNYLQYDQQGVGTISVTALFVTIVVYLLFSF
ncbi:hypothetical protein BLNAU_1003 [Blattamonas nauphoetae]|uniref:Uncharacterized protein n=1 Tax=Blattamonas nauphoetae TaxID=2049346 RepID=A0ABQ9YJJ1_9EUKA|nr:hypothetical protein BLNAU_1003 [Blattamonas nauphoetae]